MQTYTFLGAFLLLLQCGSPVLGETCPYPEDVSPCVCLQREHDFDIVCKRGNLADIQNVFQQLEGKKIGEMFLENLNFDRLSSLLFRGLHIYRLVIVGCDLKGIADVDGKSSFVGLENSLEKLEIIDSIKGANQLAKVNLSHLKKLRILDLNENNIPEVDNDWFKNGPLSLESIALDSNDIRSLGDRAFEPLVNLEDLSISDSSFKTFRRTMLPNPVKRLDTLYLVNVSISSLPDDAFSGMPSLKYVYLSQNSITQLPSSTWSSVWSQLRLLTLDGNPIECDSDIEWTFPLKRPTELLGTCSSPNARKDVELEDLIDDSKKDRL